MPATRSAPSPRRAATRIARALATTGTVFALCASAITTAHAQSRVPVRTFTLTSPAFESGALMPPAHTQAGRDVSPPLAWSGAPDSVRSYVLLLRDLDAVTADSPDGLLHWLVWNIPGSAASLPAGVPSGAQREDGSRQISVSGPYYRGPAAPSNGPPHHYLFELYALDGSINVPAATLSPAATRDAVLAAMAGRVRGKAVLVARYRRPAP